MKNLLFFRKNGSFGVKAVVMLVMMVGMGVEGWGQTVVWQGGHPASPTAWSVKQNWVGGKLPIASDAVSIPSISVTNFPIVDANAVCNSLTIETGASLTNSTFTLTVGGNWTNNGTFTAGTGTVVLAGASAKTISGSSVTTFFNLTITGGVATINEAARVTVTGALATNGLLTINSAFTDPDIQPSGSLIVSGSSTGNVTYNRYVTGPFWHLISSPVVGQTISGFLGASGNNIDNFYYDPTTTYYGLSDYFEMENRWNEYFTINTAGNFTSGKGYEIRRKTTGIVSFTGTPGVELTTYPISKSTTGKGWNCIGNPFTSAININTDADPVNNFLSVNGAKLNSSYAAVYVWVEEASYEYDATTTYYRPISNSGYTPGAEYGAALSGVNHVQVGQGFFVCADGNSTISLSKLMQSHQPTVTYKSTTPSWPGIRLIAAVQGAESVTDVTFDQNMTKGLDVTYDAGLLRANPDFVLFSRLIEDNGVDFSLQCLPENEYDKLIIPIGLDCKVGGQVTFSARLVNLPETCKPVLFDQQTNIATDLSVEGAKYNTTVAAGSKGIGRFYLYTNKIGAGVHAGELSELVIYSSNKEIHIEGLVHDNSLANLYDMSGRMIGSYQLQPSTVNILQPEGVTAGLYLLVVQDGVKRISKKLDLN